MEEDKKWTEEKSENSAVFVMSLLSLCMKYTRKTKILIYFFAGECGTFAMLINTDGEDIGSEHWRKNQDKCVLASVEIPYSDCGGI